MHRALAAEIVDRLASVPTIERLCGKVWFLQVPAAQPKPYVVFTSDEENSEETSTKQTLQRELVQFTVVGDRLADQVEPVCEAIIQALEDYVPDLDGVRVMRAQRASGPVYESDQDANQQDVVFGGVVIRYTLQFGRRA